MYTKTEYSASNQKKSVRAIEKMTQKRHTHINTGLEVSLFTDDCAHKHIAAERVNGVFKHPHRKWT